jgi:general secretion pathway protein I
MRRNPRRRDRGFTLLEVLVAFIIAALALGVLFQGLLTGLHGARAAGRHAEALSHARSHLAALGHGTTLVPGETEGDDGGGFRFRRSIVPVARAMPVGAVTLYAVRITISWSEGGTTRRVDLVTQRVAAGGSGP